jgi:Protein of unknown function (DUF3014)
MAELGDLKLDKPYEPPPDERRFGWRALLLVLLLVAVGYLVWSLVLQREKPASNVKVQTEQQVAGDASKSLTPVPGEDIDLPALAETDPIVRQLVGTLSSHPKVAAWLTTDQLIRNFATIVVNISNGRSPARQLGTLRPTGEFVATEDGEVATLDPRSYRRYDDYAEAIGALDAQGTARLYATLKPRLQDAYRELGYPEGDFDQAMQRAIIELLNTPIVDDEIALIPKSVSWEFADPKLQSLSSAQRQFLRMGPRNMRIVKDKLRELAPLLGITLPS